MSELWLSITEASKILGVHPSTLRRWADADQVPYTRTHGGHRRFSLTSLNALRAEQGRLRRMGGLEQRWSDAARSDTRRELKSISGWASALGDDDRRRFRKLGRDLLDLTKSEISSGEQPGSLQAAAEIGTEYAHLGSRSGLTLVELTEAVLLAHSSLTEAALSLPEVELLQRSAVEAMTRAIQRVMQAVHLAMVAAYMAERDAGKREVNPIHEIIERRG
ncbi:MAG: helix-turn-helix domain-containing protein [Anaerolineales bacterium]|jgi:excisionase family DNA binding protein